MGACPESLHSLAGLSAAGHVQPCPADVPNAEFWRPGGREGTSVLRLVCSHGLLTSRVGCSGSQVEGSNALLS
jgi:hypothetical protein